MENKSSPGNKGESSPFCKNNCIKEKCIWLLQCVLLIIPVIYITLIREDVSLVRRAELTPFWSYFQWWNGNKALGVQIIENIILFIPLGYSLSFVIKKMRHTFLICLVLSVAVEFSQYFFRVGLCEWDDVFNNTLGGTIGIALYNFFITSKELKRAVLFAMVVVGLGVCTVIKPSNGATLENQFAFQVENAHENIQGFFLAYDDPTLEFDIALSSNEDNIVFETITHIKRTDVEKYFLCGQDYSHTGFIAIGEWNPEKEYEILVKLKDGTLFTTGQFIKGTNVYYSEEKAPDFHGTLLVARPDFGFYVYQDGRNIYWLGDTNAGFEDDDSTYIQYQLRTTQTDKLPQRRLENKWYWDNMSFIFEEHEIEGFGDYRVAKASLPEEYSIMSIVTGYYTNDEWVWKEYFRPILKGVFF